ncbi:MAG TPA: hypothetical protein VNU68_15160 [Verrucomicrobiae bacterium]|nr:hypothetical protein [Verrucomicrobiae bacterium]
MARKYHQVKKYRTQFRRLAFGEAFWLASNLTVAPFVKLSRTGYLGAWAADGSDTETAVSATNVAVVRCPGVFLGQNRTLS